MDGNGYSRRLRSHKRSYNHVISRAKWVVLEFPFSVDVSRLRKCEDVMIFFKLKNCLARNLWIASIDDDKDVSLSTGRVCVRTNCMSPINEKVQVKIKDVSYDVEVKELRQWSPSVIQLEGSDVDSLEGSCEGEEVEDFVVDDDVPGQSNQEMQMESDDDLERKLQGGDLNEKGFKESSLEELEKGGKESFISM
ncbi:hypothetical protein L1987_46487 [Smallanthus sonchifolius]|uniref:Uncharacterized protein n=1 Tax=Smallanthus sonchifolius TaxID=185202 RepID=A0ACB9FZK6_9ASTR|nr:hypothetical protein L1987_46487 [Smallanthus sonchifolius]